ARRGVERPAVTGAACVRVIRYPAAPVRRRFALSPMTKGEPPVIVLPRSLARRFRAVLRRSLQDLEQRNAWPLLLCRADERGLTLEAVCPDFALRYQHPGTRPPETLVFRSSVLSEIEGRTDAP